MLFFDQYSTVTAETAKEMIASGDIIVIDVRSPEAYEQQHIAGAVLGDKKNWDHFAVGLDKSKQVICYCYKGISSKTFCKKLKKSGFAKVYNLQGGFDAWKKSAV
jgi:thiosulfate sulfurtransferase